MALAPIPNWVNVNPLDFTNVAMGGARLGLERAAQTQQALEESARLGLSYNQLAAQNARAGEEAAKSSAAQALQREGMANDLQIAKLNAGVRAQDQQALNNYRMATLMNRMRDKEAPEVGQLDIGGGKTLPYLWSRSTGVFQIPPAGLLQAKQAGLTDAKLADILEKEKSLIINKYKDPLATKLLSNDPAARSAYDSDMVRLKGFQSQIDQLISGRGRGPADALTQPQTELPTPSGGTPGVIKVQRDPNTGQLVVPGATPAGATATQTGTAAPALPPIPGLAPPGETIPPGLAAAQSRIAARQGRSEAAARADLQSQIDSLRNQLTRANTGRGTFMGQEEYADKYGQLQQLLSKVPQPAVSPAAPSAADQLDQGSLTPTD